MTENIKSKFNPRDRSFKKYLSLLSFLLVLTLALTGCESSDRDHDLLLTEEESQVYSFQGENEDISIEGGQLLLAKNKLELRGGSLEFKGPDFKDILNYQYEYSVFLDGEKHTLLLNSFGFEDVDQDIEAGFDLGRMASESSLAKNFDPENTPLHFQLTITSKDHKDFKTELDLNMKKK